MYRNITKTIKALKGLSFGGVRLRRGLGPALRFSRLTVFGLARVRLLLVLFVDNRLPTLIMHVR